MGGGVGMMDRDDGGDGTCHWGEAEGGDITAGVCQPEPV